MQPIGDIIDCPRCGLRYSRQVLPARFDQKGAQHCVCGGVLGSWEGKFTLTFEPEDARDFRWHT